MNFDSHLDLVYGPDCPLNDNYGREPGRELGRALQHLFSAICLEDSICHITTSKLQNYCRKLYMMHTAGKRSMDAEKEFISTQNRECPSLIWEDEIEILYHVESFILFARSALDVAANIFALFLLEPFGQLRVDSFNAFSKHVLAADDLTTAGMRNDLAKLQDDGRSWFRLLCGSKRGRSLRDQIAHQTIVRIEYLETCIESEKEHCHVVINTMDGSENPRVAIDFHEFHTNLSADVMGFVFKTEDLILATHGVV